MLSVIGFLSVILLVVLLLSGKISLPPVLILLPIIAALVCGFGIPQIAGFINTGLRSVLNTAALFTFSVIFFNAMGDVGMFDLIVSKLLKVIGNRVPLILLLTCMVAFISHLDGSGATTMLITIPTMLPLFKKMNIKNTMLLFYVGAVSGIVNMLPWTSAVLRLSSSTGLDAYSVYQAVMPVQVVGLIIMFASCFPVGKYLQKKGCGMSDEEFEQIKAGMQKEAVIPVSRGILIFDMVFTLALIVCMLFGLVSANVGFMLALAIALPINFRNPKDQVAQIKKHGSNALYMIMIIFSIGVLVGIMGDSGMMSAMTDTLIGVMPESLGSHLPFILCVISVPLSMCVGSDAVYMVMAPILGNMTMAFGGTMMQAGTALMIGSCLSANLSLVGPTPYLALGLAECEMKDHLKANFLPTWILGIILAISAVLFGLFPF